MRNIYYDGGAKLAWAFPQFLHLELEQPPLVSSVMTEVRRPAPTALPPIAAIGCASLRILSQAACFRLLSRRHPQASLEDETVSSGRGGIIDRLDYCQWFRYLNEIEAWRTRFIGRAPSPRHIEALAVTP